MIRYNDMIGKIYVRPFRFVGSLREDSLVSLYPLILYICIEKTFLLSQAKTIALDQISLIEPLNFTLPYVDLVENESDLICIDHLRKHVSPNCCFILDHTLPRFCFCLIVLVFSYTIHLNIYIGM